VPIDIQSEASGTGAHPPSDSALPWLPPLLMAL
jgi:hypothetical protein